MTSTRLEKAMKAYTVATQRYMNSSWEMGPVRREELKRAAEAVRAATNAEEEARNG